MFLQITDLDGKSWLVNADQILHLWQGNNVSLVELIYHHQSIQSSLALRLEHEAANALRHKLLYPDLRQAWSGRFIHIGDLTINERHILTASGNTLTFVNGFTHSVTEKNFAALQSRLLQPWHIPAKPDGLLPELVMQRVVADDVKDALESGHPLRSTVEQIVSPLR